MRKDGYIKVPTIGLFSPNSSPALLPKVGFMGTTNFGLWLNPHPDGI